MDDDRIEFVPVPIFHGPVQYARSLLKVRRSVRDATSGCDAAILRLPSTVGQLISKEIISKGMPYAVEVVFDAHDGAETAGNIIERVLWRVIDRKMREICKRADGVSCVTEYYLQRHYFSIKENSFTSHYSSLSIDKSFFSGPRTYPSGRTMKIAHVDLQINLLGRKGTAELLQAIKILRDRGISIIVSFAGEDRGGKWKEIRSFAHSLGIDNSIEYAGFLTRLELENYLDGSDIFVLPTKAEGLPRVIIEAIAKGLPVVTTPVSGNPELIQEDFLVEYDDVYGLADKIENLVVDKELYEEVSRRNYQHSLQYESKILQARRDDFYGKLLSRVKASV